MTGHGAIETANAVLAGRVPVPAHLRVLTAAHVARCALEQAVTANLARLGHDVTGCNGRSRLIALRVLDPVAGAPAGRAWDGLSRACHRHAFELSPGEPEVRSLIESVRQVVARA